MKGLPFAITRGAVLAQILSDAGRDPLRNRLCPCCGGRMLVAPDRAEQTVRCPACARRQLVSEVEETPWRLSPTAAEALRRTRTWLRRL
jgi:DNA-directed RNA polymerase subunit RPC12/RpoP